MADRADQPLHIRSLPRRTGSAKNFSDLHGLDLLCELVSIPEQIARHLFEWESFPKLLGDPIGGGLRGHVEVQNAAAIMSKHEKHVEDLKAESWHGEEVNRQDSGRDFQGMCAMFVTAASEVEPCTC